MAKQFSFLTDTTKNILCNEEIELIFRFAFAERLAICISLLKRLTTSINSSKKVNDDKSKVGYKFSDAKGVVEKGKEYLKSILECFDISNIPIGVIITEKLTKMIVLNVALGSFYF